MAKFDIRWAQLDVARQMETVDFIEKFIVLLADSGYNGLLLYLEDRIKTASYQLPADNEVYTADDIKRIVKFAAEHNVEVIPCVATLGHAERFLRHKELEHLAELQGDMIGRFGGTRKLSFCVTHPDFYDFIGTYLKEVAELFPSKWFHVGLDEFWDFNLCERCKKAMPTLMDEQEMFITHLLKIRDIMASCGKRIMLWSDMFEFYPDVFKKVPNDIVMVDWLYGNDIRNYQGHLLDVDNEDRLAVNAARGLETIVAPADRTLSNSQTYFEYANGKPGVLGGLLTCWEKSDTFLYRTLPVFVSAGLQMNGMSPDEAYDAMCVKLFGTDDAVFKSALKIALNNGLLRHFDGVKEGAICTRDYYGISHGSIDVCAGVRTILQNCKDKVTTELGKICLDDLIDALLEKKLSNDAKLIAQNIFDTACTPERQQKFADFRKEYAAYFDLMIERWKTYRSTITPNVFAERKAGVMESLEKLEKRLASNAWIKLTGTLPDYFGVEFLDIEYKVNGEWVKGATGCYKPSGSSIFNRFIALENAPAGDITQVRLTAHGLGGVGVNFVEISVNGKRFVPRALLSCSGRVADAANLLKNNTTFAWFGGQCTRYDYFDRNAGAEKHSVTLEMEVFSTDDIAMAQK